MRGFLSHDARRSERCTTRFVVAFAFLRILRIFPIPRVFHNPLIPHAILWDDDVNVAETRFLSTDVFGSSSFFLVAADRWSSVYFQNLFLLVENYDRSYDSTNEISKRAAAAWNFFFAIIKISECHSTSTADPVHGIVLFSCIVTRVPHYLCRTKNI